MTTYLRFRDLPKGKHTSPNSLSQEKLRKIIFNIILGGMEWRFLLIVILVGIFHHTSLGRNADTEYNFKEKEALKKVNYFTHSSQLKFITK